jgi:xylan 1,4-beta-xylosidase
MPAGHVRMGLTNQLRAIDAGFTIVACYPELKKMPVIIGESDPEGCAACPVRTNPSNAYRNGTMYSSYTAEQIARTYEFLDLHHMNLLGAATWAFEFEDQPYFDGFRDLATNGIDKPVLNIFKMLGQMKGDRVQTESTGALSRTNVRDRSVRQRADVAALASRDARSAAVLVWNYHDDDLPAPPAEIDITIDGLPASQSFQATVEHYRVDNDHSNAYTRWKSMGSPQVPGDSKCTHPPDSGKLFAASSTRSTEQ